MWHWLERVPLGRRPPQHLLWIDEAALDVPLGGTAPPAWHTALQPLFAALAPHEEINVVVADAWCRFWLTPADPQAEGLAGLQAAAAARAQALYGLNAADWVIEADWQAHRPFLCCALPQDLLAALRRLACAAQVTLRRVQPHALHAFDLGAPTASERPEWRCHASPRTLLSLVFEQGQLQQVRHSWRGPSGTADDLPGLLREQAAQLGRPEPTQVTWLNDPPSHRPGSGPLDFSLTPLPGEAPVRRPLRALERSLWVTALALLAGAWAAAQALDPGPDTPEALSQAAPNAADPLEPPPLTDPADALRETRELAHFPWPGVLDALEGALPEGVDVSSLELRATDARLKLGVRADGVDPALAMAERLVRHPGLAALRITQQDVVSVGGEAAVLQISLEGPVTVARWRPGPTMQAAGTAP